MSNQERLQAVIELLNKANNGSNKYTYAILTGYFIAVANDEQTKFVEELAQELARKLEKQDN